MNDLPARQSSVIVELTQRCNHQCPHCYNVWKNGQAYPRGELDTRETIAAINRVLEQTGAALVTLTGGEPLLRADIVEIVQFLCDRGRTINLITNGTLLDDAVLARLLPASIAVYELPLLGPSAALHDRMSGRPGAFDACTLAIARLKAARQRVVGVFVATRWNLPAWRETAELGVALGLDGLMFNRFNPGGEGARHIDELQASPDQLDRALEVAEEITVRYGLAISCSIPLAPCLVNTSRFTHLGFGTCAAGTDRAYYTMDPLGNVRPCNHSPRILGNILREDFASLVRSPSMHAFASARPALCAGCAHEHTCQGGCKAAAEVCCGTPSRPDPFLQAFH